MTDIKLGEEVRLLQRNRRRRIASIPADGCPGVVTKIGRKYATAVIRQAWTDLDGAQQSSAGEFSFDMETGIVRGTTEGLYILTPEQIDRERRRKEALYLLDRAGLEFKLGYAHFFTLEQIEALAEVVKTREG